MLTEPFSRVSRDSVTASTAQLSWADNLLGGRMRKQCQDDGRGPPPLTHECVPIA